MDVRVGLWRKLSTEKLMLLNCGVGEDSWESLGLQGDQPVHPKGDQSWVFIGRTDVEAETPIFWPPDAKSSLIGKDPDVEKHWRQEEKGATEDEMAGWHHWLNGHEFGWTLGVGDEQGGLASAGHGVIKSWTRLSDWTELIHYQYCGLPSNAFNWPKRPSQFLLPKVRPLSVCHSHHRSWEELWPYFQAHMLAF